MILLGLHSLDREDTKNRHFTHNTNCNTICKTQQDTDIAPSLGKGRNSILCKEINS
jgi:hypothetical protein